MADPNCLPPIPEGIAFITGPTMLGICLNWGFMGVTVVQIYIYHINFPDDKKVLKALVYTLFLLDCLQTGMVTADAFHWFVFGFGNLARLDDTFLNSWDVPMLDAIISLIAQTFYSWRIYVLRRSFFFPVIILMVSLCQCAAGIAVGIQANKLGHLSLISTNVARQTTWLVGATVADILITAVLTWTLLRSRKAVPEKSHKLINRIVTLTVETNSATALIAIIALILFFAFPQHSTFVVPPTAIMGKMYANCLIAVLNNRKNPAMMTSTVTGTLTGLSSRTFNAGRGTHTTDSNLEAQDSRLHVDVVKDFEVKHDADFELSAMDRKMGKGLKTAF